MVAVPWFHCLGQRLEECPVVAHTLPTGAYVDGLLGMEIPARFQATISVSTGEVILFDVDETELHNLGSKLHRRFPQLQGALFTEQFNRAGRADELGQE